MHQLQPEHQLGLVGMPKLGKLGKVVVGRLGATVTGRDVTGTLGAVVKGVGAGAGADPPRRRSDCALSRREAEEVEKVLPAAALARRCLMLSTEAPGKACRSIATAPVTCTAHSSERGGGSGTHQHY